MHFGGAMHDNLGERVFSSRPAWPHATSQVLRSNSGKGDNY